MSRSRLALRYWPVLAAALLATVPFVHGCSSRGRRVAEDDRPGRVKLAQIDGNHTDAADEPFAGADPFLSSKVETASATKSDERPQVTSVVPQRSLVSAAAETVRTPRAAGEERAAFAEDFDRELDRLRAAVAEQTPPETAADASPTVEKTSDESFEWAEQALAASSPTTPEEPPAKKKPSHGGDPESPEPNPFENLGGGEEASETAAEPPAIESPATPVAEEVDPPTPTSEPEPAASIAFEPAAAVNDEMIVDTIEIRPRFGKPSFARIRSPRRSVSEASSVRVNSPAPEASQPMRPASESELTPAVGSAEEPVRRVSAPPVDFENLQPTFRAATRPIAPTDEPAADPADEPAGDESLETRPDETESARVESEPAGFADAAPILPAPSADDEGEPAPERVEAGSASDEDGPAFAAPFAESVEKSVDTDSESAPRLVAPTTADEFDAGASPVENDPFAAAETENDPFANAESVPLEGVEFPEVEETSSSDVGFPTLPILAMVAIVGAIVVARRRRRVSA